MDLQPVIPFEPILVKELPSPGDPWIAQVKWDGVRMLTYYDGRSLRLINRRGNDRTLQYPEFAGLNESCRAGSFILDGEMIALTGGKPSFHQIMGRDSLRRQMEIAFAVRRIPVIYMVFDLLYCDGEWVTGLPLRQRQDRLRQLIIPNEHLQLVPNVEEPAALYRVMEERGWEGIVCKNLDSSYAIGGKDGRWQKLKLSHDLQAVIGGVTYRDGQVNALLLGLYDEEGRLIYIGHAGSARWRAEDWSRITKEAVRLTAAGRPFLNPPARLKDAVWLRPELTVKVSFMEWTLGGTMRHPVIQGWSPLEPMRCLLSQSM
ncbi:ATP-dependent DNA ligase [Paenibacillus antibioticophila]|uniref:ATP-dependent DNA ligase n=1 Tax=Paenibacillus antibioticophila TaxID=1274374 RepID=UPI0005C89FFC|nr:RNA ligase family protein [Paenibacillus antibioticophila]